MHTFADAISPISVEEFTDKYLFRAPLRVGGDFDRFGDLFTWETLNALLSHTRHDPLRVHVDKVGASDEELVFTHDAVNVRGESLARIDPALLYVQLRDGATLVIDAVNDVVPAVADLSEDIATLLSARCATTVLFCSFRPTPGFIMHWDNRDVFALQVEGRKHWRIHEPTHVAPLMRGDAHVPGSGEPGPLYWEGVLERGDFLYLPRGWWHEVRSTDSASVHLNLGFDVLSGFDYLTWLIDGLHREDSLRMDIPRFDAAQFSDYERRVTDLLIGRIRGSSMGDFLDDVRAKSKRRVRVSLPFGVDGSPLDPGVRIALTSRTTRVEVAGDQGTIIGAGARLAIPSGCVPAVDHLLTAATTTLNELTDLSPGVPAHQVGSFVVALIGVGIVHVVS